ncbi:MAG: glycosyltransferase family 39 protein, partial [Armatimonadetes bacterium]|nr:glycosyltransferase family 39 protein [Armatimonadota bacterium]
MAEDTVAEPVQLRRLISGLQVLCLVIAGCLLYLPFRSADRLAGKPLTEDGYYALTVARNIGLGRGITIDGERLTNGFQPLFTFVTAPGFAVCGGNRYLPLRIVLLLHWAVLIGTAWVLGLIARDAAPRRPREERELVGWLTGFLYLASLHVFTMHLNGLETGLLMLMCALCWRFYQVRGVRSARDAAAMGALLGLTVLARIDAAVLAAIACLWLLFERRLKAALVTAAVALVVSSPWWIYNRACFGTFMPSSGTAQMYFEVSALRLERSLQAVTQAALPMAYFGLQEAPAVTMVRALVLLGLAGLALQWRPRREAEGAGAMNGAPTRSGAMNRAPTCGTEPSEPRADPGRSGAMNRAPTCGTPSREAEPGEDPDGARRTIAFGGCVLTATLVLVAWYTAAFAATHFYTRYFSALSLVSVPLLGYVGLELGRRMPRVVLGISVLLSLGLVVTVWALAGGRMGANPMYVAQLPLVRAHVPEGEAVGAGQSGTLGYFRDRVLNLDGKVNPEALRYQGRIREYLQERNVRWFCDWPEYADAYLGEES